MSDKPQGLTSKRRAGAGGFFVQVTGSIDESLDKAALTDGLTGIVVFDLDGVKRITSYGVREWVNALQQMRETYCGLVKCRPAVVSQFNMVEGFAGRGQLLSFYAPYVCPSCNTELEVLIDVREKYAELREYKVPAAKCTACGADAEFDDVPESYLSYVASTAPPTPPPEVHALISGTENAGGAQPLRIQQQVAEGVTALWLSGALDKSASFKRLAESLEGAVVLIFEQVTHAQDVGLQRLQALLSAEGPSFHLARVPQVLWDAFAKTPAVLGRASVVSWLVPVKCQLCGTEDKTDFMAKELWDLQTLDACKACGAGELVFQAQPPAQLVRTAAAPEIIAAYLEQHPKPPQRRESTPGQSGETIVGEMLPAADEASGAFGRYQLIKKLGLGGMAEVFLARLTGMGGFKKNVVLKRILPHLSSDSNFITMFLDEARIAARLSHPNVVQIFEVGNVGPRFYIAMEYVRGWDLNSVLRLARTLNRPVPIAVACRITADVCAGLHAAHSGVDENNKPSPIIHRDVSPHNVLVSADGQVKLADFGIAKALDSSSFTPSATVKGKLSYMAPEQLKSGSARADARADIFAAGLIFYQLVTGEQLYRRDNEAATVFAILREPVPKMSVRRPDVPAPLEAILLKALEKEPEARYQTAKNFQQDIEAFLLKAGQASGPEQVSDWLQAVIRDSAALGALPREMNLTPTGAEHASKSGASSTEQQKGTSAQPTQSQSFKPE